MQSNVNKTNVSMEDMGKGAPNIHLVSDQSHVTRCKKTDLCVYVYMSKSDHTVFLKLNVDTKCGIWYRNNIGAPSTLIPGSCNERVRLLKKSSWT